MNAKTAAVPPLKVSRLIKAPRERVFAAWTTPADILKWFGPGECRALSAYINLKVGGEYRFRVCTGGPGGCGDHGGPAEMDLYGTFREIKAPAKLVYTWNWRNEGKPEMEFGETLVTVEFLDRDGITEVQLTHEHFPQTEIRDQHTQGWTGCLDKLEKLSDCPACQGPNKFVWNELMTQDLSGSAKFYAAVFGWETLKSPVPGMDYTIFKNGDQMLGGMMQPSRAEAPSLWLAYITVENADATVDLAVKSGATVCVPAFDVPTIGKIAILRDPQGAGFGIMQPAKK